MPLFCERFYSLGVNGPGGFAEYVAVNYDKVFHISDSLTFEQAAFAGAGCLRGAWNGCDRRFVQG